MMCDLSEFPNHRISSIGFTTSILTLFLQPSNARIELDIVPSLY